MTHYFLVNGNAKLGLCMLNLGSIAKSLTFIKNELWCNNASGREKRQERLNLKMRILVKWVHA